MARRVRIWGLSGSRDRASGLLLSILAPVVRLRTLRFRTVCNSAFAWPHVDAIAQHGPLTLAAIG
jgi:hypothetical protein